MNSSKLQRAIRLLIVALLTTTVFLMLPKTAFAADGARVKVTAPGDVAPGQEFTATVDISDNPGFTGAMFKVIFDADTLELVSVDSTVGILDGNTTVNSDSHTVGYLNFTGDNSKNGELFKLNFKVKDGAVGGSYNIGVGLNGNHAQNFVNSDAKIVPISFVDSQGNVTAPSADSDLANQSGAGLPTGSSAGLTNSSTNSPTNPGASSTPDATVKPTTPDGQEITKVIDAKNPGSGSVSVEVGKPFFIQAEEGSLVWDADQLDGRYDSNAGGYILTPKKEGSAALTYTNQTGNSKSIPIEIQNIATPLTNAINGVLIILIVIVVIVVALAAVAVFFVLRKRKQALANARHSAG